MNPHHYDIESLTNIANEIRGDILRMLEKAGSGHPGGSLGMADVFVALYFSVLNYDPNDPLLEERDRVVLSNGHICPVLYATLARAGRKCISIFLIPSPSHDSHLPPFTLKLNLTGL